MRHWPSADRSGAPGIDRAMLDTFMADARVVCDWHGRAQEGAGAILALGEATGEAVACLNHLRDQGEVRREAGTDGAWRYRLA